MLLLYDTIQNQSASKKRIGFKVLISSSILAKGSNWPLTLKNLKQSESYSIYTKKYDDFSSTNSRENFKILSLR